MHKLISLISVLTVLSSFNLYSQQKGKLSENPAVDFKLISASGNSVEIEYIPGYISETEFVNAVHSSKDYGKPDLGSRNFPIITPSNSKNRIEILDIQYTDLQNITVRPVPVPKKANNKLEALYDYKIDEKIYSQNSFFPQSYAEFIQDGMFRDKHTGIAKINTVQYNPLSKTVRKIQYIRFRVIFGDNPVTSLKKLSAAEYDFINGLFINWKSSLNWSSREYASIKPNYQRSVLASGDFYRLEVKENGFYKLDKNYFVQNGINVSNIDPRTIRIYNNGGSELPYLNSINAPIDPVENPVYFFGEQDGKFDDGDYLVFFGNTPHQWFIDQGQFYHKLNSYSNSNYYYLTFGQGINGIRMPFEQSPNTPNVPVALSFKDKFFEEPEVNNLGSTGDLWISQRIGYGGSVTFGKNLPGYVQGSEINFEAALANGTYQYDAQFYTTDPNAGYSNVFTVYPVSGSFSHITIQTFNFSYILSPGQSSLNLSFRLPEQYNQPSVSGYYDYLEVFYERSFNSAANNYLRFNSVDTLNNVEYQVSQFTSPDIKVFRVNGYDNITIINPISYTNGIVRFQDNISIFGSKEFYIVGNSAYKTPVSFSARIPNQNLKDTTGYDFIIITPTEFRSAADRLKILRESPGPNSPDYLKTLVVDINQIYTEFSAGIPDPVAMRNYMKYAFINWTRRPVYALLLGDGSYDYTNIYGLSVKNFIPPIERSDPFMNEITSYNSDDFIFDINENYTTPEPIRPDFSHGRFCVNTLNEANFVVDKLYEYADSTGIWKKKIMYVADDGWTTENNQGEEGDLHTRQCENIAELYTTKDFEKEKIYIVTYPSVITPQGRRKPGANADIIKGWNDGRLLINYTGHGSEDLWAHEHVFVKDESIPQMKNRGKYPLVTIASCDLARWDDPFLVSAAEQLLFVDKAGAIGVIAATRPVYANFNEVFNNYLWSNLMFYKDTLNLPIRVGKAMYNVKNQLPSIGENDLKFCLIGDPSMRISIPQYFTSIDSINSTSGNDTAEIKALQKMRLYGSVLKADSSLWNNFNGDIIIKVLDVDKYITFIDFGRPFNFRLDGGIIFKGSTKVVNGKWNLEFVVPKDISYSPGLGKIIAYFNSTALESEGSGYTDRFRLNGIDSSAAIDTTGPEISLYMDSRNFRSGDLINQNSKIIADFFDENGINLTGAIGHKIEAVINGNENNKIDLTSFYNATSGYKYGSLSYDYTDIPEGEYSLKLKAWDTYNNLSESEITFKVKNNSALSVFNVFNYPNPMKDNTNFTFQHNLDASLTAEIKIFSVAGRNIKNIKRTNITEKFVSIDWDGKDSDGDFIANGTYIYKLIIKSEDGAFSSVQTGKLAKLK